MTEVDVTAELQRVKDVALALEQALLARDPSWRETAERLVDACLAVAHAVESPVARGTPALGQRIAELAARGSGVRAIALDLGVSPSTVSRRLRTSALLPNRELAENAPSLEPVLPRPGKPASNCLRAPASGIHNRRRGEG
jgi:hypothetical protein